MSIIKIENVSYDFVSFDENENKIKQSALKNINLQINEGDFLCIIGKNGSGKSTLGKLINGLYTPTEGDVFVFDNNTKNEEKILEIRKNVGMVFQNPDNQIVASIVEEEIAFGLENIGMPTEQMRKNVDDVLSKLNILNLKRHSTNKLSGGQKQRVALCSVLAMKPKVIIFDEPTAMLDMKARLDFIDLIYELNKNEKITIILITHFMEEIRKSDRVIVIDDGNLALDTTPKQIFLDNNISKYGIVLPKIINIKNKLIEHNISINENAIDVDSLVEQL